MIGLSPYADQMVKQEQHKDLLRQAEHRRLIKAVALPGPNRLQKVDTALRKAMDGIIQHLPSLKRTDYAQMWTGKASDEAVHPIADR